MTRFESYGFEPYKSQQSEYEGQWWAPPDLNRSLCLPKAQVYQANPRARVSPSIPFIDKRVSRRMTPNRCCVRAPS